MNSELIKNEIKLSDDECCIVFDFGCYYPYANFENINFEFSLGMEKLDNYKINHRYPNKRYQTISKKYGRKVSKLGYPYIMKLDEQSLMILTLEVGIKEQNITLLFPLLTKMTRENPICGLTMHYLFDESKITFSTYEKVKDGGWVLHNWLNYESNDSGDIDILLNTPHRVSDESNILIYDDIIEPYPVPLFDLKMLVEFE